MGALTRSKLSNFSLAAYRNSQTCFQGLTRNQGLGHGFELPSRAANIPCILGICKNRKGKSTNGIWEEEKNISRKRNARVSLLVCFLVLIFNLKYLLQKAFRLYRQVLCRLQYRLLKHKQEKDFVYADRANWADQNLSSNIYFHIVNVNILFCLQDKWSG